MKKTLIAVISALCFTVSAFSAGTNDFDSICTKLAEHPNMTGNFSQIKTISAVNRSMKSSGKFIFSLDGIMWKTEKPFPSTMVVGMKSVKQTLANGKETVIDASSNQIFTSISSTLSAMFGGDAAVLKENFNIEFSKSGSEWKSVLVPKDAVVQKILKSLTISGTESESFADLNKIVMSEATGDSITYTFTDQKYPKELTADEKSYFSSK